MTELAIANCCCPNNPYDYPTNGSSCFGCNPGPDDCPCPDGSPWCWDDDPDSPYGGGCPSAHCAEGYYCLDNPDGECCETLCGTTYCCCDRCTFDSCFESSSWDDNCNENGCGDATCSMYPTEPRVYAQSCMCNNAICYPANGGCHCFDCVSCLLDNCCDTPGPAIAGAEHASYVRLPSGDCVWMECVALNCPYPPCPE